MLNFILFLLVLAFLVIICFIIDKQERKERLPDIYSGELIGLEDYRYINFKEVRLLEPVMSERIVFDLELFTPIYIKP